jgi:hypothetical protein
MMTARTRVAALVVCVIVAGLPANAQTQTLNRKKSVSTSKTSTTERQSALQMQRLTAIQMINTLVDESERFKDETLRAQVQARAADALWDGDPILSRELFLRAWKSAEKVDKESERLATEVRAKTVSSRGGGLVMLAPTSNVRIDILKIAARRDSDLAENLLTKLTEAKDEDKAPATAAPMFDPTEPAIAIAKRLEVAATLLDKDVERATAFAQPALRETTTPGIIFLCTLRHKDAIVADNLYSQMLVRAGDDLKSDATTVSLLSSYIFTPNLIVTATRRGRAMNPFADTVPAADQSPALRSKFFHIGAGILLRPPPLPNQDLTAAGRAGTFFTIARLLPLFEQYATPYAPALKAHMIMLSPDVPETSRSEDDQMLRAGLVPASTDQREPVDTFEQQLARTPNSADRDLLYLKAIQSGAASGDMRIRELAGKIEDTTLQEQARAFADLAIARNAIASRDPDRVLRLLRDGYLNPLQRVWALTSVASMLAKSDFTRAMDVLGDATSEAMRIRIGEPTRVYALVSVALSLMELDKVKSGDLAFDIIKAVNAVSDFNSDGGRLYAQVRAKNIIAMINAGEPSFNMAAFFERLSKQNLPLAISLANEVKPEAPRAAATLAIAGLMLKGQNSAAVSLRE